MPNSGIKVKKSYETNEKFYKRGWFILLSMFFVAPLGVFLWFRFPTSPDSTARKIVKGIISGIVLVIWAYAMENTSMIIWTIISALGILVLLRPPKTKSGQTNNILKWFMLITLLIVWLPLTIGTFTGWKNRETFDINGNEAKISCPFSCTIIDEYGEEGTVKALASIGVKSVDDRPNARDGDYVTISVDEESHGSIDLLLSYKDNKLVSISHADYPSIVYYTNGDISTPYPAKDQIANKKSEAEENARKQAEADAKAKAANEAKQAREEEERKAAEEKVPTSTDTISFCTETFHNRYPYNGSKVHSIIGVIADDKYSADSRLYKVEVTIQNAFGAEYGAVMECLVRKSGDTLHIDSFNVY